MLLTAAGVPAESLGVNCTSGLDWQNVREELADGENAHGAL